jgi:hypothetical protein
VLFDVVFGLRHGPACADLLGHGLAREDDEELLLELGQAGRRRALDLPDADPLPAPATAVSGFLAPCTPIKKQCRTKPIHDGKRDGCLAAPGGARTVFMTSERYSRRKAM